MELNAMMISYNFFKPMITENTEIPFEILSLVEKFSLKWLENKEIKFIDLIKEINHSDDRLYWDDPENIESGLSGIALIFIEIFRKTNDRKYFDLVEEMVYQLISYSKEVPTNNYSLFTGRSGVVYVILQFHLLRYNKYLLDAALDIIEPAKLAFLNSKYVNDSLYEGRAGTLLTLCNLYELTQNTSLLEDIRPFIYKIIDNAILSAEGIYWKNTEEFNIKPLCGFARGTAGIKYVLNHIKGFIPADVLKYLNTKISLYEDSCWIEEFKNWGNFSKIINGNETLEMYKSFYNSNDFNVINKPSDDLSWGNGAAGIGITKLFCDNDKHVENDIRSIIQKLKTALKNDQIGKNNLSEGLAGVGCFFLEAGNKLLYEEYSKIAIEIADEISIYLSNKSELSNGLLYGDLGCLYFLLLMTNPEKNQECVLYPFNNNFKLGGEIDHDIKLSISNIRRELLDSYFPRTIYFLEKITPGVYMKFFFKITIEYIGNEVEYFVKFMNTFLQEIANSPIDDALTEIFRFENERYIFLISKVENDFEVYIDELVRNDKVMDLLNKPYNEFENIMLIRSRIIKVVSTKWSWSGNDFPLEGRELIKNLYQPPGQMETIFYTSYNQGVVENGLDFTATFWWHRFKKETKVNQALIEIKNYCNTLKYEDLKELVKGSASDSMQDLRDRLYLNTIYKLKELLYNGVLIVAN